MELEKSFNPHGIESRWYPFWESKGYFKAGFDASKPSFSIQLPPPNVTGTLHMGHAYQQTLMDILTRYHRMKGYNTLWQPGTTTRGSPRRWWSNASWRPKARRAAPWGARNS